MTEMQKNEQALSQLNNMMKVAAFVYAVIFFAVNLFQTVAVPVMSWEVLGTQVVRLSLAALFLVFAIKIQSPTSPIRRTLRGWLNAFWRWC